MGPAAGYEDLVWGANGPSEVVSVEKLDFEFAHGDHTVRVELRRNALTPPSHSRNVCHPN
jgi:hypothetical protein